MLGDPAVLVLPAVEGEGQDDVQLVAEPSVDAHKGLVLPLIVLAPNIPENCCLFPETRPLKANREDREKIEGGNGLEEVVVILTLMMAKLIMMSSAMAMLPRMMLKVSKMTLTRMMTTLLA